ncbi:hypothetical protein ABEY41_01995 [Peribacillus butanolivorans]|uniref:hypothetical protein n=1 Tax=Peribacillus butanolivorans TaxID=421767 RepID=UPI003D26FB22
MKKALFIKTILLILIIAIMGACSNKSTSKEENVNLNVQIDKLTDDEFKEVQVNYLKDPKKDDFRKFSLTFQIDGSSKKRVNIPDFKKVINTIDNQQRYWFGNSSKKESDNSDIYKSEFIFYSKGITEDTIIKAFEEKEVKVIFYKKDKIIDEKQYNIGDSLIFE